MRKITFRPYKKQFIALQLLQDKVTNEVLYWGWARWAKSYLGCAWCIMNAYSMPWSAWLIWRNELKRLKATTLITFFEVAKDLWIKQGDDFSYNAQDSLIKFKNGSIIFLIDLSYMPSDPNYDRLWSYWITYSFIDEAQEVNLQAINILKWRYSKLIWEGWQTIPKALYTCNPAKNWIYREFYNPYKNWTIRSDRAFVPSLVTDNPSISQDYIENLKKADEVTVQRLLYWNFDYDDTPWRLFDYNKILELQNNQPIYWEKFITCDPAREWRDKTIIMLWNWLVITKVIQEDKSNLKELKEYIRNLALNEWVKVSHIIVDENWLWWWLVDELWCQWFINNARQIEPRIMTTQVSQLKKPNYDMLKTQCYHILSQYVNQWKILYKWDENIFSKLIEELDIIVQVDIDKDWKFKIISKEDIKEKIWRSPDVSDCMMFRMFYEIRKPIDLSWVQSIEEAIILNPYEYKQEEKAIEFEIEINPYN